MLSITGLRSYLEIKSFRILGRRGRQKKEFSDIGDPEEVLAFLVDKKTNKMICHIIRSCEERIQSKP